MKATLKKMMLWSAGVMTFAAVALAIFIPLDRPPDHDVRFAPHETGVENFALVGEFFQTPPLNEFIDRHSSPTAPKYEDVLASHGRDAYAGIRSEINEVDFVNKSDVHLLADGTSTLRAYFGTVHAHSALSDGKGTVEEAFRFARDFAKLDFMALTDHPEYWLFSPTQIWAELAATATAASTDKFIALRGFEYSSAIFGHYIVLETSTFCSSLRCRDIEAFYNWLSEEDQRDAIVFFAHPGFMNRVRSQFEFDHFRFEPDLADNFVGIEVMHWDGYKRFLTGFEGKPYIDNALEQGWLVGASAAEDNHGADWGMAGNKRLGVLLDQLTRESLLSGIRERRFYATNNENLQLAFYLIDDNQAVRLMGSRVDWQTLDPSRLDFHVRFLDPDKRHALKRIELVVNGKVMAQRAFEENSAASEFGDQLNFQSGHWQVTLERRDVDDNGGQDVYAYVRLYQGDGEKVFTHSSPIFIVDDK